MMIYPKKIYHWIENREVQSSRKFFFSKYNPATGQVLTQVTRGSRTDVNRALRLAERAFPVWSQTPVIRRAEILREAVLRMRERKGELADIVALESGKPRTVARGEVDAAIECGFFFAGEGRRYVSEVLTSAIPNRHVELLREPVGVGALITPFNNPAAGVAWKLFPALLCGNTIIIKSHSDTPYVAIWYAKVFKEVGLPPDVLSVIQGLGTEVGAALVADRRVRFVSFTGSLATGQAILKATANRLAKVSIEAGGKNPLVVCDDADLEKAVEAAVAGAFVDAGQRCAATSRIIVFNSVYDSFKKRFLNRVRKLRIGTRDSDDYGAIIREERLEAILAAVEGAKKRGALVLTGGYRLKRPGYFLAATVLENVSPKDPISCQELFGPVVVLYRARNFTDALRLANLSDFKLTGAIHTQSIHRAQEFIRRYRAGVVRVNGPTHGSEPHMPFGGMGLSGNGWREPGTKAFDFYSEWKQVSMDHDPRLI